MEWTKCQEAALSEIEDFLISDESQMIIKGGGGVGKTFLVSYIVDKVIPSTIAAMRALGDDYPYNTVHLTATTNKAAGVLSDSIDKPVMTIHNLLELFVHKDWKTGKSTLRKKNGKSHHFIANSIVFIDEAYMVDYELMEHLRRSLRDCKIIFVGDDAQLLPVMGRSVIPSLETSIRTVSLETPVRSRIPIIMENNLKAREAVLTGNFLEEFQVNGKEAIHVLPSEAEEVVEEAFKNESESARILCYKNQTVIGYNQWVTKRLGYKELYNVGQPYISNNMVLEGNKKILSVDQEVTVASIGDFPREVHLANANIHDHETAHSLLVRDIQLLTKGFGTVTVKVPVDMDAYLALIRQAKRQKNWPLVYELQENFCDLRPAYASTVHKSQGSTYDTVFIDLNDLHECTVGDTYRRLLYVAMTRARKKVYFIE